MNVLKTLGIALAVSPLFAASVPAALDAQQEAGSTTPAIGALASVSGAVTPVAPSAPASPIAISPAIPAVVPFLGMAPSPAAPSAATTSGPAGTAVALQMKHAATETPAPLPRGRADSKALMIVGAAAVVAGIIVGDDAGTILILGGAGVGLYGLYKYMQ